MTIPETVCIGIGGTRRAALLAGVSAHEYPSWSVENLISAMTIVFDAGTRHIFTPIMMDTNANEKTPGYAEHLLEWTVSGVRYIRDTLTAAQVRLLNVSDIPTLVDLGAELCQTAVPGKPTLWLMTATHSDQYWQAAIHAAQAGANTQREITKNILGDDVPLATLFIGFGKPEIMTTLIPPFIIGRMQCYWRQGLGYSITAEEMNQILTDYKARQTWQSNKNERNGAVSQYQELWDNPPIIGLGQCYGPFWYPS